MAHEIDMSNGRANVMVAGDPAWHELGQNVSEAQDSAAAIGLAGLDWEVQARKLFYGGADDDACEAHDVPSQVALVRSDTGALLSIRSESYVPLQNREAFRFVDDVLGGDVRYETAGSLKGGRVVWVMARIPGEVVVGEDDVTYPYLLLSNSHDGTQAVRVMPTMVRVVCNNTLNLAMGRRGVAPQFTMWHTPGLMGKVNEAKRVLGVSVSAVEFFAAKARALAGVSVSRQRRQQFMADLFPVDGDATDRQRDHAMARRAEVTRLFEEEPANNLDGIRGSAWALLNAATHYVDHDRYGLGGSDESERGKNEGKLRSIWVGSGAKQKALAWDRALAMVN